MSGDDVRFEVLGRAGFITLDRQPALNAVTYEMIQAIDACLEEWEGDRRVERVAVMASPGRAFSAGGDLRALFEWKRAGNPRLIDFYRREYRLNRRIRTCRKPFVALIDGIVMGGGVGVSFHGSHRIVTENAVFAMPETGIGFFPDIGASWLLSRCPGRIGEYLALTGARLKAADLTDTGLATHAIKASSLNDVEVAIAEAADLDAELPAFLAPTDRGDLADQRAAIDEAFAGESVETIVQTLERWPDDRHREWAQATAASIRAKAPLSQKVALRQIRLGRTLDFDACLTLEFRLVNRFVADRDFFEGIRAAVIDKDRAPRWQPPRLEDVGEGLVSRYFAPIDQELCFAD